MAQRGTDLEALLIKQAGERRVLVLNGLSVATCLFVLLLVITLQVLWIMQGPFIPFYMRWMADDPFGLIPFAIGLGVSVVLAILHYVSLQYSWRAYYRQAQELVRDHRFHNISLEDSFIDEVYEAVGTGLIRHWFMRPWPGNLAERIESSGAFLQLLDQQGIAAKRSQAAWLAYTDWLASCTWNWIEGLNRITGYFPRKLKLFPYLAMVVLYPFILPGGYPYMRRNASVQAIAEYLLDE